MLDTHSHLYSEEFDADRPAVVQRALAAGVTHVILPNENLASLERQRAMHARWPQFCSMTIGLHPEEVKADFRAQLAAMEQQLTADAWVAVGEIGIDLYWDKTFSDEQAEALDVQLHWCKRLGVPFIIHCREGLDVCLSVMRNFGEPLPPGVFHSFTGSVADVEQILQLGDFYFGVGGIVTFKRSQVPELLPAMGLPRILLETDSPYLAPVPRRGTRNESANIPFIAACIAHHLGVTTDEVATATTRNAHRLFTRLPEEAPTDF